MATWGSMDQKKTKNFFIPYQARTARFYLLPKIHKSGNLGKPIVCSNDAQTENISCFVDFFLQPGVIPLPSYSGDTTDFINKVRGLPALLPGSLLVILSVSSYYTNISHDEGIRACEEYLNSRESLAPPIADLYHLIQLVLSMNLCLITLTIYKFMVLLWVPIWPLDMVFYLWGNWKPGS